MPWKVGCKEFSVLYDETDGKTQILCSNKRMKLCTLTGCMVWGRDDGLFLKVGSLQDIWWDKQTSGHIWDIPVFCLKAFWVCSSARVSPENLRPQKSRHVLFIFWPCTISPEPGTCWVLNYFWLTWNEILSCLLDSSKSGPEAQHFQNHSFYFKSWFPFRVSNFDYKYFLSYSLLSLTFSLKWVLPIFYSLYSQSYVKDCCLCFVPFFQFYFSNLSHSHISLQVNYS